MDSGDTKSGKGAGGLEENEKYPEQGRSEATGFRIFFKPVVQLLLLFGVEAWVVTLRMVWFMGCFQYQVAQQLTGRLPQWRSYRRWGYTLAEAVREEAGFEPTETYIWQRYNMVA